MRRYTFLFYGPFTLAVIVVGALLILYVKAA
jgi:hypothetical protein